MCLIKHIQNGGRNQNARKIFMLWQYDVVTFNVNCNYTNARLSMNMTLHCCQLLLFGVNVLIS